MGLSAVTININFTASQLVNPTCQEKPAACFEMAAKARGVMLLITLKVVLMIQVKKRFTQGQTIA